MKYKKTFVYIAVFIVLMIPGILATMFYIFTDAPIGNENSNILLEIKAPSGESFKLQNTDSIARLICDIIDGENDAASADSLSNFAENGIYSVSVVKGGKKNVYTFYFDKTSPSKCFFTDNDGKVSSIKPEMAIEFMDSRFAATLYSGAEIPTLSLNGTVANPAEVKWEYYSYSSVKHEVDAEPYEKVPEVKMSYLDFNLKFSKNPDSIKLEIKNSLGIEFFKGSYAEFVAEGLFSKIRASEKYDFKVEALWADSGRGYCGNARYHFKLDVDFDPPGSFWLSASEIESGGFVVLSGKNIIDKDSIEVSSIPALAAKPMFFEDGDYVRALLPVGAGNATEDIIYQIKVSYDGISSDFMVKTVAGKHYTRDYNHSNKVNTSVRTEANLNEFYKFITAPKYEASIYVSNSFVSPAGSGIRATFGDTINNTNSSSDKFMSPGMAFVYYQNAGNAISACMSGKVVAVGETTYGGNTVVVDHGLGLRSVYYCISRVDVIEGQMVNPGDRIGAGSKKGGYTDGETCYIDFYVGNVPVSYRPLSENGFGHSFGIEPDV